MLSIIANNPYRVLGVYANSRKAAIIANKTKSTAFLKVGKAVEFPLDLKAIGLYSSVNRTVESMNEAEATIAIPKSQIKYAQFWFLKATPLDDVAFNHLIAGDISQAKEIWTKKESLSSLQNTIVCHLLEGHWRLALSTADKLYEKYGDCFVNNALGITTVQMSGEDLLHQFIDVLSEELGAKQIMDSSAGLSFEDYIKSNAVLPLINRITEEVNKAKKIDRKDARARKNAGQSLMVTAKECLAELKKMMIESDPQYQIVADKIGLEILQCSIDYFNNTSDKAAPGNALKLLKYAQSIVVGSIAKQRCQENITSLQKIIDSLPPSEVSVEDKSIKDEIERHLSLSSTITNAVALLNATKPYLQSIKRKLGANNPYYLDISTTVVKIALHDLIEEVNSAQEDDGMSMSVSKIMSISTTLRKAWNATTIMDEFDMESGFRSHYNQNRNTLKSLCNSLGISTSVASSTPQRTPQTTTSPRPAYSTPSSHSSTAHQRPASSYPNNPAKKTDTSKDKKNNGCIIAIVALVVLGVILGFVAESTGGDFIAGVFWAGFIVSIVYGICTAGK